jgi:NCS1 family nucleobase:cation symporter-1
MSIDPSVHSGSTGVSQNEFSAFAVEQNGLNVIAESERKGSPRDLFWPWCAANISVLGLSYASFVLGFGLGIWQALFASVVGTIVSFLLVGLVSLAGKRGSAPTMALSRAPFGVRGNLLPAFVSYLYLVGWEIVLVSLSTLATATVFGRLGWNDGNLTKVTAFVVVAAVIVGSGVLGFDLIMRLQRWLTVATVVMTIGYIALTLDEIDFDRVNALQAGTATGVVGALLLMITAFGLGWTNSAADYSRYLPRSSSSGGVVGWTVFGGAVAPVVLLVYGLLLVASRPGLNGRIALDPIGALTVLLPTWYLVPFAIVAVAGLVAGAVLDIYSSGLTLLSLGLPLPRWTAAAFDGVLMIIGTIYVVWVASDFLGPFIAFLITLGVPIAAWCGVFLADLALRRKDYSEPDLFDSHGRYGSVNALAVGLMAVGTAVGWGLVVGTDKHFDWEGYLLDSLGLGGKTGSWAYSNIGIAVSFAIGLVGYFLLGRTRVRAQESNQPMPAAR